MDRALTARPKFGGGLLIKTATLVHLGRLEEAGRILAEIPPAAFAQLILFHMFRNKADLEHLLAALEKAG